MDFSPDCSIIPIPGTKRNIVSSIDFFYPVLLLNLILLYLDCKKSLFIRSNSML